MDTAYKTRAWWMIRALTYATDVVAFEDCNAADNHRSGNRARADQAYIWGGEARKAGAAAAAPSGAECLTRQYVDRQGNTLPHLLA